MAADEPMDAMAEQVLDGNAVGGMLAGVFGVEMTDVPGRCANCHRISMVGAMRAYTRAPGIVLRCPWCDQVVMRFVRREDEILVDVRGAMFLRFRSSAAQ
jgi:hypothetical protein